MRAKLGAKILILFNIPKNKKWKMPILYKLSCYQTVYLLHEKTPDDDLGLPKENPQRLL